MTDAEKKPDPSPLWEPTLAQQLSWNQWVGERSKETQELIRDLKLAPWRLYRLKDNDMLLKIVQLHEPTPGNPKVTLTVEFPARLNPTLAADMEADGIDPNDLEWVAPPDLDAPRASVH